MIKESDIKPKNHKDDDEQVFVSLKEMQFAKRAVDVILCVVAIACAMAILVYYHM
jgi:hypothetical protein